MKSLDFEKPLDDLYEKIEELKLLSNDSNIDLTKDIAKLKKSRKNERNLRFINTIANHSNRSSQIDQQH